MESNEDYLRAMQGGRRSMETLDQYYKDKRKDDLCSSLIAGACFVLMIILLLVFGIATARAEEYSTDEIVNAIYLAEGGAKAQFPYGIRSVTCESKDACRKVCENTVKNNRVRFAKYGHRKFASYLDFLASRYCPTSGRNLSKAERRLNGNWTRNVRYFLAKARAK